MNASSQIDQQIKSIGDWRGDLYARLRKIIHEVDPDIVEEFKWGTGVFTHNGMVCAVGTFKDHVKLNFFQGAALSDPDKLFNGGLEAKKTRSVDWSKDDSLDETALKKLLASAVAFNTK